MLSLSRFVLFSSCLLAGQVAIAAEQSNKIISCFDPSTGSYYLSNLKTDIPQNCQNIKTIDLPQYKSSENNLDTGLRESEKAQLKALEQHQEQVQKEAAARQPYDQMGQGIYGAWLDKRQDMCFAYRARVEEAQADRKDDVKLNRQIQRDLTQINYYCR